MEKIDKAIEILEGIKNNKKVEILYGGEWRTYINNVSPLNFTNYEYRIFEEPTIKPYSNGREFYQEALKHGMFVTYKNDNDCYFSIRMIHPESEGVTINTSMATNGYVELDYNELLQQYQWADGSPCGVTNEDIKSNDKTINVGFIREFMKQHGISKYTINDDGTVDVDGDVSLDEYDIVYGKTLFKFGKVSGDFICVRCGLESLEGCPTEVNGDFNCSFNNLTSLKGAPRKIGGSFDCSYNKLSSLEGGPEEVSDSFYCSNNELFSLEGGPEKVEKDFVCSHNQLTSLEGSPLEVGGDFFCLYDNLISLKGCPKEIGGDFDCRFNKRQFTESDVKSVCKKIGRIYNK